MIKVLQNWQEVGEATLGLQRKGLPTHITVQKNWDQFLLEHVLTTLDRQSWILDLGCGDCCTLDFLAALGFTNLHGIDLKIKKQASNLPYKLYEGDMTATPFPSQFYDFALSISVIEHGVDLEAFFKEAHRLLKAGGLLFITTDYWEEKIQVEEFIRPFGVSWKIFSKAEIQEALTLAKNCGFILEQNVNIPACADETVFWYNKNYTFIALAFRKGKGRG